MSGTFPGGTNQGSQAVLAAYGNAQCTPLMQILNTDALEPGADASYEACKIIYSYHPLGSQLVDAPLILAQSQPRKIEIPDGPEADLVKAFEKEWKRIGKIGADQIIFRAAQVSQIYGISTLGVNYVDADGKQADPAEMLPLDDLHKLDLYFNVFDPLNTAGSLVLNQDPLAVDFMHPKQVIVAGKVWSPTKTIVLMHEQPVYIQWSNSAFGFVGRSVYQRPFFSLRSYAFAMIANQKIQEKLALLVYKAKSPGSVIDQAARYFKQMQRTSIQQSTNYNVVSIGETEDLMSLNLEHVHSAGEYSLQNIMREIAVGSGRPFGLIAQTSLAEGFGEGTEDAKQIANFINTQRSEMSPIYDFMDQIVMRRAWSPDFYKSIQKKYPERYGKLKYNAALHQWMDSFVATWPNLLTEPDSEKAKAAQLKLDSAVKIADTIMKIADPETKATTAAWLADFVNGMESFEGAPLMIDPDLIAAYTPPAPVEPDAPPG